MNLGREIIEQEESAFARDCALDRMRVIRDTAALLERMEEMSENDMGNLSYREAASFHAITERLRRLVDRLANSQTQD